MSDNATLQSSTLATPASGTVVAADDVGSALHQRVKLSLGADGSATDLNGDATGGAWVQGAVAHDAATAAKPVLVGGAAQTMDDTAPPNRVSAESDVARLATDLDGAVFAHPHGAQVWSYHDDDVAAVTTDGTVHAAPGAGLSLYVTDIVFSTGAATASSIFLEESTTKVLGPYYTEAVAGRGVALHFQTPKKITSNTALLVTNTGSISFSVDITGYTAPA